MRGADHGERSEREPKRVTGGKASSVVQGLGSQEAKPPEDESFLSIFIQKGGQKLRI